jgi:hypothetical protein
MRPPPAYGTRHWPEPLDVIGFQTLTTAPRDEGDQRGQQQIDNPVFPLTFLGAGVLTVVAFVLARRSGSNIAGWIVVALYVVTVVITLSIHLPLNEALMQAGDPARIVNLAAVRDDFEIPWVAWALVLRGGKRRVARPHRCRSRSIEESTCGQQRSRHDSHPHPVRHP